MKFISLCIVCLAINLVLGVTEEKNWTSLQEAQSIDGYTKKDNHIYCGEVGCGAKPMLGVNVASFKVCPGSKYAKDSVHVYYPISIDCIDYATCGVCACNKYVINNVIARDFAYLGKDYATDKVKVFFRGEELLGADGKSFRVIDGPEFFYFAVDENRVYKHDQVFPGADPSTFYYDQSDKRNDESWNHYIVADKRHKWLFIPPDKIKMLK